MNEQFLAAAVVEQAVTDWKWAIAPTSPQKKDFIGAVCAKRTRLNELRRFLMGNNADLFSGGQAKAILAMLEKEYMASKGRLQIEAYERGEIG